MAGRKIHDRKVQVGTTNDATLTNILTYALPDSSSCKAIAIVVGRDTVTGDTVSYRQMGTISTIAGVSAFISAAVDMVAPVISAGLVGTIATMTVSGGSVKVNVQGLLLKTIDWQVLLEVFIN